MEKRINLLREYSTPASGNAGRGGRAGACLLGLNALSDLLKAASIYAHLLINRAVLNRNRDASFLAEMRMLKLSNYR